MQDVFLEDFLNTLQLWRSYVPIECLIVFINLKINNNEVIQP